MVQYRGDWSKREIGEFLADRVSPLRLGCITPKGFPWIVCLWFLYRDESLWCATSSEARVVEYLKADPICGFDVSTNDIPYRGIRGNARARLVPDRGKTLLKDLLARYLGSTDTPLGRMLLSGDRSETAVEIVPETVFSWDFTERMQ